jgi:hypothetical protein
MERPISGTDVLLMLDLEGGTNYKTLICVTSNGLNATVTTIESSTKCGDKKIPGTIAYDIPFEGELMADPDTGKISGNELFVALQGKVTVGYKIAAAVPQNGDAIYTGKAFIASLEQTFANNESAKFTGSLGNLDDPLQTIYEGS